MPEPGEVKAARNRAGLTQQQLADILGVHVKTLRDYEKGKRARLRAGQAKLADFIAAHPEPPKNSPPAAPAAVGLRPLAEATDMELIAVLTSRLALLRAAVDGPIPVTVEAASPTAVLQTVVSPVTTPSTRTDNGATTDNGTAPSAAPATPISAAGSTPDPAPGSAPDGAPESAPQGDAATRR